MLGTSIRPQFRPSARVRSLGELSHDVIDVSVSQRLGHQSKAPRKLLHALSTCNGEQHHVRADAQELHFTLSPGRRPRSGPQLHTLLGSRTACSPGDACQCMYVCMYVYIRVHARGRQSVEWTAARTKHRLPNLVLIIRDRETLRFIENPKGHPLSLQDCVHSWTVRDAAETSPTTPCRR